MMTAEMNDELAVKRYCKTQSDIWYFRRECMRMMPERKAEDYAEAKVLCRVWHTAYRLSVGKGVKQNDRTECRKYFKMLQERDMMEREKIAEELKNMYLSASLRARMEAERESLLTEARVCKMIRDMGKEKKDGTAKDGAGDQPCGA